MIKYIDIKQDLWDAFIWDLFQLKLQWLQFVKNNGVLIYFI